MAIVMLSFLLAVAAICFAGRYGDRPERLGALVMTVMVIVPLLLRPFIKNHYATVDPLSLFVDVVTFLGFSAIGIYSRRIWPLWASSLQLLSVGAHFIRALSIPVRPIVYAWMKSGPSWAVCLLLIGGTLMHRYRLKQHGSAPS